MELLPGEILTRSEQGGTTFWVIQGLLEKKCQVTETYLWKARSKYKSSLPPSQRSFSILPDNDNAWRWARINGFYYYALDRIPNRAPKYYRDQLPPKQDLIDMIDKMQVRTKAELMARIKQSVNSTVSEFMSNESIRYFRFSSEPAFSEEKATELAEAKAWCDMISTYSEGGRFKRLGLKRKEDFLNLCTELIQTRELEGLRVKTVKSLRKKLHYYPSLGSANQMQYLISGKYGNNNARKVGKFKLVDTTTGEELAFDMHEALMFNLYMNPGNPQKEDLLPLWEEYKSWLGEFTTENPIAYRTFTQYCSRFDTQLKTAKARHGEDYYSKHFLTYAPSEHLKYAHSLFAGDGSATVAYKYYDKEGTCRRMNLYVILISDVSSRYIAGWAPAKEGLHNETPSMTEQAVKMAVESGGYMTMHEIVTDNHGAFTSGESKELLNSIFNKVRTIRPNNSQANPAETQFRLFKKTLKRFNNFLRTSWAAGLHNQANPDFIPNNELLPTYEEAIIQLRKIINDFNNKKLRDGTTPAQRFVNKHPDCVQMDERQLRSVFGYRTQVEITRMRGFVEVWKGNNLHKFEVPGYYEGMATEIASATGYKPDARVRVIWTTEAADIYAPDGRYLCTCQPAKKTSQSKAESNEKTDYALGHHEKRKRIQLEQAEQFEAAAIDVNERLAAGVLDGYNIAVTDNNFSKEEFNKAAEQAVNANQPSTDSLKEQSRHRVDRDFNEGDWIDIDN